MTFNRKKKKSVLEKMTIRLGITEDSKFDGENLIDILSEIPFNLININLNMKKSDLGVIGKGYNPIGFVNRFYTNEKEDLVFDVAIFENFKDKINAKSSDDFFIVARVFTNKDNKITKIIGLDLIYDEEE